MKDSPRRVLREFLALLASAADCKECVQPQDAFVGKHGKTWRKLEERMREVVKDPESEAKPN